MGVCGSRACGLGMAYSAISPVVGFSFPMWAAAFPVYQILPSRSATRPCGPEFGTLSVYSRISPVRGSRRPNRFATCPVYQSVPSGANAGSCGREFGVGTSHSTMTTSSGSTATVSPADIKKRAKTRDQLRTHPFYRQVLVRDCSFFDGRGEGCVYNNQPPGRDHEGNAKNLLSVVVWRLDTYQSKIDGELAAMVDLVLRDSLNDG